MSLETYISEFSKYVLALCAALYTVECVFALLYKKDERLKGVYLRQILLIFAFHFSAFMVICFETGQLNYLIFYALQQITLYGIIMIYKHFYSKSGRLIINNMCMLLSISFVELTRLSYAKALRQFIIAVFGLILMLLIPFFIHIFKLLKRLKWIYAALGVGLLGVVLILGQTTYGSRISYTIAGISFQPAEFVKVIFVLYVASALYNSKGVFDVFTTAVIAGAHVVIQVLNKDLGSALIFFVIYICMVYVATGKLIYMLIGLMGGAGASIIAYRVFSHVQSRITAWQDPFAVIDGVGYQITQSLFGISSGGLFGLGLFKGAPEAIPFVDVDFIFSAIAEEMGIIFAVCLILICLSTFVAIMKLSNALNDEFYALTSFGLGVAYIFQVFLTIGGGTKFIPLTGVTLPLVSYGGSSMLTTLIMIGIIEGMYIIRADEIMEAADKKAAKRKEKIKKKKEKAARERNEQGRSDIIYDNEYEDVYEAKPVNKRPSKLRDDKYKEYTEDDDDIEFIHGYTRPIRRENIDRAIDNDYVNEDVGYEEYSEYDGDARNDKYGNGYIYEEDTEYEDEYTSEGTRDEYDDGDFPYEEIGEIYYNEEEYEKDRQAKKAQK